MKENNTSNQEPSKSRRYFLKGSAAAAAPVIMTVASRPVLGAQCTPSAWVSGNLSDHGHTRTSCGGFSPGYWKARPEMWPGSMYTPGSCATSTSTPGSTCTSYNGDGTKFNMVFASGNTYYDGKTLMQVLWLGGNQDPYQLGAHIVAALLNAATVTDYGMTVANVKEIYRQLVLNGVYQPSAGNPMTAQDVVAFIQNTFN